MLHPETQLSVARARHSDLLRASRASELAARIGEARRDERRSFLARLRRERTPCHGSTSTPSTA